MLKPCRDGTESGYELRRGNEIGEGIGYREGFCALLVGGAVVVAVEVFSPPESSESTLLSENTECRNA